MTDTYEKIKDELRPLYPEVTDDELDQITKNLINFFVIGAKALYASEKEMGNSDYDISTSGS